ncbi:hypothetical protein A3J90_04160 [candidate division WOR-1 bacterium RIFOXYC2_FULL_37_10]|uniref:Uncharacterized protein n=1 Tax=candidate division WOR-1 bacterium RIFOXYB2_FULL_37_13 TaxID=1802579 RepID=A0A1F4SHJ7_UNCSA|nr:MAG: hypothetical protein A2246_04625 [candidate division WOR-1 bacterium RIFOXYA2_FULL_37_7]OGC19867.1 MAG: hypothetical protein A2310_05910 [candidate division WOR-1 bacterium RIFOXYB2_FULL_37_13]OGC32959.1 MAG: hypothetical protein A3J90_04160 [candidate division WOR-1 bacterium RIFOXYC2_FULL_37_10]
MQVSSRCSSSFFTQFKPHYKKNKISGYFLRIGKSEIFAFRVRKEFISIITKKGEKNIYGHKLC